MKILMGVDLEYSGETVRALVAQCRPESTEVMVLHVLQLMGTAPTQMDPYFAPELEAEKVAADELVGPAAKELHDAGFQTQTRVERGDIRGGILDSASEWGADLIVLGSHHRAGLQRFLLGSVAEFVARHARCSVEIIRNGHSN
jgi:nucleotide-binding universal stress UspA family protein